MGDKTRIEWTDATWNPVTGCTKVSPGCDHCYIARTPPFRIAGRKFNQPGTGGTTGVQLHPERLDQPLRWKRPRRVFVNSLSDLFHDEVPDDFIAHVFAVMALARQHTFQVLTKRHGRMRSLLNSDTFRRSMYDWLVSIDHQKISNNRLAWPLPNVWLGVSVEDQKRAEMRIPALLGTPAAVKFLSCEPLLGPVDLRLVCTCEECGGGIDWVIAGGESGRDARPAHPDWVRGLRDQCEASRVAFFFKQWGEWVTEQQAPNDITLPGWAWMAYGEHEPAFYRVGKRAAGRELDGQTWDEMPTLVAGQWPISKED